MALPSLTKDLEQVPEPQGPHSATPGGHGLRAIEDARGPSKAYRARVSLMSLRMVVVTEVPRASVIWKEIL